jgi:hypothetical protein
MPEDLLIAHNPEEYSKLPYLVRIPIGDGLIIKTRETWPRTNKVYCHRAAEWPTDVDIVQRLPVQSISKRGAAIDLVLQRSRESRSQFVITQARGREMIFWQSARTAKQARPNVSLPTARAHGQSLLITVDSGEKYPYKFAHQQAETCRKRLPVGDYAVYADDRPVAVVERKSVADLTGTLLGGRMSYLLSDLASLPRAAVVVEESYGKVFDQPQGRGSTAAEALAEAQARFPAVPIVFFQTRGLAQEWIYRWFGACLTEWHSAQATVELEESFASAPDAVQQLDRAGRPHPAGSRPAVSERTGGPSPAVSASAGPRAAVSASAGPSPAEIRAWAKLRGLDVPNRGRIPNRIRRAWQDDQSQD